MIKSNLSNILDEILPDDQIKSDEDKLVIIGSNSILALNFVTVIEEYYNIEFDNDVINHKFFSDLDYLKEVIEKSINQH